MIKAELWQGTVVENPFSEEKTLAFVRKNKYYFKMVESGIESKIHSMILGGYFLDKFKKYREFELVLYSGRKHLFIQECLEMGNKL